jgi:hypothetical protein
MGTLLTGTLPVKPFELAGFVGTVESDGQHPQVAALACEADGRVICLSLIGAANSISSAMAKVLDPKGKLAFLPAEGIMWDEPHILARDPNTHYKELGVRLRTTLHVHCLCLSSAAHLGDGLVHPPVIPQPEPQTEQLPTATDIPLHTASDDAVSLPALDGATSQAVQFRTALAQARPRYLFGNWSESTPNERSFLGVLRGLRVIFVNAPPQASPALIATMRQWANSLWAEGNRRDLIAPIPSPGIRAWRLTGDLARWSDLVSEGVRERWLDRPST